MASPIDSALLAAQTYKPRKAAVGPRARAGSTERADQTAGIAAASRRNQPAVAVSLSAEALQILSGIKDTGRHARPQRADEQTASSEEVDETSATDEAFEVFEQPAPRRREAPFAHLAREETQRIVPPGSRLDIRI